MPQRRKSLLLSTISIKDAPKRKKKVILKKFAYRFLFFFIIFIVSLIVLVGFSYHTPAILSPIPTAFSQMLHSYEEKNPTIVIEQVKTELVKHHIAYSSIAMNGGDVQVQLDDDIQAILSSTKSISDQLDSLQVTIAHLTIEGKRISRVDVRFERPVVTFK